MIANVLGFATDQNRNKPFVADPLRLVYGYLPESGLCCADRVSRFFNKAAELVWETRAKERNHCPEKMPPGVSYKRFVLLIVPRMFGKEFHEAYFGRLPDEVPPIPDHFIAKASKTDRLVYVPPRLAPTQSNGRPLSLDPDGCLIEGPSGERTIIATMNLRNMAFVVEKCLLQGYPTGFAEHSWPAVLTEHGATPVTGGWYLLREAVEEIGWPYADQKKAVEDRSLEVSFLPERVWCEFCRFIQTKKGLDPKNCVVRTATITLSGTTPYLTSLWWANFAEPSPRLGLSISIDDNCRVGVAVGVPAR